MKKKHIILLLLPLLLLSAGCASKRYYKKALKYDESGLYEPASELYYMSLKASKKNIDARLGLQRTGQLVLDDKLSAFRKKYESGFSKDAVYAFRAAETYKEKLSYLGVNLNISEQDESFYREVKDEYIYKLYLEGSKALRTENFSTAERIFSEVLEINPQYKDSKTKWQTAKYEPLYRSASQQYENKLFRSAYYSFNQVIQGTGGYKQSIELQAKSRENAKVSIMLFPVSYAGTSVKTAAQGVQQNLIQQVNKIPEPFYNITLGSGYPSLSYINPAYHPKKYVLYLQQKKMVLKDKTILAVHVKKATLKQGSKITLQKKAYLKVETKVKGEEGEPDKTITTYEKVYYTDYTQTNEASLSLDYSFYRPGTDRIIAMDNYSDALSSSMHYATYKGNYKNLVPGTWRYKSKKSNSDKVDTSTMALRNLHALFRSSKKVSSAKSMQDELISQSATKIGKSVRAYKPEN